MPIMDTTTSTLSTLKTLNRFSPFQVRSSRTHLLRPLCLSHFKLKHHLCSSSSHRFLPFCSLSERGGEGSLPRGVGEAVNGVSQSKLLQVVLVSPQIPGNTGCIARTCAASAVGLHLVGPLGFQVDDAKLKRAGLDYWPYVVVKVHNSWADFQDYFRKQEGEKRLLAFTKRGTAIHSVNPMSLAHELHFLSFSVSFFVASENMVYSRARGIFDNEGQFFNGILQDFSYKRGDYLLFGSETSGLPPEALLDCKNQPFGGGTIRIPMVETYVRCLNLSVSVGIALYEASRQLNYEQLQFPPEGCSYSNEQSFITEDLFA